MDNIPLSLYVHIPWCVRKCPYCDFNSHEAASDIPETAYVDQLLRDLASSVEGENRRQLTSIFIGGGTPSLFTPGAISGLLKGVKQHFDTADIEITMETNPGTFDANHFSGYREAGVNRLSIGAQSFSNDSLEALGRIHASEEIDRAFEGARAAGFDRINLDIMHGLPQQDTAGALKDLELAIALGPEHISWYQLTVEPNTVFYSKTPILPVESELLEIETRGKEALADAGFIQYEISAYAKADEASLHNLNYWEFGDYLGIGAGAHGKLSRSDGIYRTQRTRMPQDYLTDPKPVQQKVTEEDLPLEYLMNVLRTTKGFNAQDFEKRTGLSQELLEPFINKASAQQFIETTRNGTDVAIRPTPRGLRFLNEMLLLV